MDPPDTQERPGPLFPRCSHSHSGFRRVPGLHLQLASPTDTLHLDVAAVMSPEMLYVDVLTPSASDGGLIGKQSPCRHGHGGVGLDPNPTQPLSSREGETGPP